jgi:hypothetical protein
VRAAAHSAVFAVTIARMPFGGAVASFMNASRREGRAL